MTARIIGGNLRDLSYIASNLRPEDLEEIDCQLDSWNPESIALGALQGPAYVVLLDGNPEAAFGATQVRTGLWLAWSWGTRRIKRCVPRMTVFVRDHLIPDAVDQGCIRCEARALASNEVAIRWLKTLGATERCLLPAYGKNGEDFILFDWLKSTLKQRAT